MKRWTIALLLLLSGLPLAAKELTPHQHGREQGRSAGEREGRDRVGSQGSYDGEADGYPAGVLFGQQQLVDAAWGQGLLQGQTEGAARGKLEGREQGLEQGQIDGVKQGETKARASADEAARLAVAGRAEADGKTRAGAADPQADGLRLGREAGLARAKREANEKDFARARDDYRARQFESAPKGRSAVRQAPLAVAPNAWPMLAHSDDLVFGRSSCPSPDWRYLRYGSDNEEYQRGYREGYSQGMRDGFNAGYDREYRYAYDRFYALGVAQAQVVNLQETVDQAYEEGFLASHEAAFKASEKAAHGEAFKPAYEAAYAATYAELYPQFESQHYRAIEEAAFAAIYGPPYQASFDVHEAASFAEHYPKQAKLAYDQGWKAEANDFVQRPVRLLSAWVTPTDVEGVQLLTVRLRNFSPQAVPGQRIRVSLGAQTSRLFHPLPPNSEMEVTGLLRLRTDIPSTAEVFAVIDNDGHRVPLGTVTLADAPAQ